MFGLTFALLLLSSCQERRQETVPIDREKVRTTIAVKEPNFPEYQSFGTIVFFNKADVLPTTEGIIEEILAEEGQAVEVSQVLAQLDQRRLLIRKEEAEAEIKSRRAQLELAQEKVREGSKAIEARLISIRNAEAELEQRKVEYSNIKNTYENKQKLFEVQGVSREELEGMKTQYLSAKTRLAQTEGALEIQRIGFRDSDILSAGFSVPSDPDQREQILSKINTSMLDAEKEVADAELNAALSSLRAIELLLSETTIRAPISGIVGARYLDVGERASPEKQLFTIFNTEKLYVQIEVSEKNLPEIHVGQRASVFLADGGSPALEGTVKLISPYVDPDTRTARVKIQIENKKGRLTPGLFVRVKIITGKSAARILLPEDAVQTDQEGRLCVYLIRNGRLFMKPIQAGAKQEKRILVLSGIEEGDQVVRQVSGSFRDGMEVEVVP